MRRFYTCSRALILNEIHTGIWLSPLPRGHDRAEYMSMSGPNTGGCILYGPVYLDRMILMPGSNLISQGRIRSFKDTRSPPRTLALRPETHAPLKVSI